jgi:OTU domain-containing protein 6
MADDEIDALLARHRKEQRALVSQITSIKKSATKAKKKELLAETERLERELKERHQLELDELKTRESLKVEETSASKDEQPTEVVNDEKLKEDAITNGIEELELNQVVPTRGKKSTKVNRQKARIVSSNLTEN